MPEELTYVRKASGLTRGLSAYDAFGVGLFFILPTYVIWWMVMSGLGLFPGANLWITIALTVVLLGVPSAIVWGVLGGSMPRSGGDYVYNTRILSPAFGMVASMGMMLGQAYWNIYQATFITQPSLQMIGQFMGWHSLITFSTSKWGTFVCAAGVYVIAFCFVAFGLRIYKMFQRPLLAITLATTAIAFLALLFTSKAEFVNHFNSAAATYHSLNYSAFINAAQKAHGSAFPSSWNWSDTIGAVTATFLLIMYGYVSAYVGGEVKRPSRSILVANWASGMVTVILALICLFGLYHVAKSRFLIAASYSAMSGPVKGYNVPWDTSINGLIFYGTGFNRVIGVMFALTWLLTTISIMAVIILCQQRVLFAWGMDRMGPKWFCEVSNRWASPIKGYLLVAGFSLACTIAYILWLQSNLAGLVGSGMALVTLFLITGVSATIFPYRKKVRQIWLSSPYAKWKIAGVPVVTIAGIVYVAFDLVLIYYAYLDKKTGDSSAKSLITFAAIWAIGLAWYFFWKNRAKRRDVSIDLVFGELPPE